MKFFNHLRNLNTHHRILRHRSLFNHTNFFSSDSSSPLQSTAPHVKQPSPPSSLNRNQLSKFASIAESRYYRWDSERPFKPLHVINPTRIDFVWPPLCRHFKKDPSSDKPLEELKTADVGSEGGVHSEESDPATSTNKSCGTTSEKLDEEGRTFDDALMAVAVGAAIFVCLMPVVMPYFLAATINVVVCLMQMSIAATGFLAFATVFLAFAAGFLAFATMFVAILITPGLIFFIAVWLWLIARKMFGFAKHF